MARTHPQSLDTRPLDGDADWWRLRALLVEVAPLVAPGFVWDVRRLDGSRFYAADPDRNPEWQMRTQLWETPGGRLVAAINRDSRDDAHLQVHPAFRHVEDEMVAWVEATARPGRLELYVLEEDESRQQLLLGRGWSRTEEWGMARRMRLDGSPPAAPRVADRYSLRTTRPGDPGDCRRIADLLNASFGRTFHTAEEYAAFTRQAPSFRADLDLVAVAPDGSFAAYVGVPYDDANRRGIFEPVCTHPDHRRRGLAQALMVEGIRRLRALGAADVTVETGDMAAANALYASLGFMEEHRGVVWARSP